MLTTLGSTSSATCDQSVFSPPRGERDDEEVEADDDCVDSVGELDAVELSLADSWFGVVQPAHEATATQATTSRVRCRA